MDIPRREKPENIILVLKFAKCTVHAPLKEKLPELELLFHSDRGAQYTSHRFQEFLCSYICQALDKPGNLG